jgi:hypothetical protein
MRVAYHPGSHWTTFHPESARDVLWLLLHRPGRKRFRGWRTWLGKRVWATVGDYRCCSGRNRRLREVELEREKLIAAEIERNGRC